MKNVIVPTLNNIRDTSMGLILQFHNKSTEEDTTRKFSEKKNGTISPSGLNPTTMETNIMFVIFVSVLVASPTCP